MEGVSIFGKHSDALQAQLAYYLNGLLEAKNQISDALKDEAAGLVAHRWTKDLPTPPKALRPPIATYPSKTYRRLTPEEKAAMRETKQKYHESVKRNRHYKDRPAIDLIEEYVAVNADLAVIAAKHEIKKPYVYQSVINAAYQLKKEHPEEMVWFDSGNGGLRSIKKNIHRLRQLIDKRSEHEKAAEKEAGKTPDYSLVATGDRPNEERLHD